MTQPQPQPSGVNLLIINSTKHLFEELNKTISDEQIWQQILSDAKQEQIPQLQKNKQTIILLQKLILIGNSSRFIDIYNKICQDYINQIPKPQKRKWLQFIKSEYSLMLFMQCASQTGQLKDWEGYGKKFVEDGIVMSPGSTL